MNAVKKNLVAIITAVVGIFYLILLSLNYFDVAIFSLTGYNMLEYSINVTGGVLLTLAMWATMLFTIVMLVFATFTALRNNLLTSLPGRIGCRTLDEICRLLLKINMILGIITLALTLLVSFNEIVSVAFGAFLNPIFAIAAPIVVNYLDKNGLLVADTTESDGSFRCPICRAKVPAGTTFCPKCGNRIGQ